MLSKNPVTMSRGFSLIELLVVITIIAVLSTIGLIAYSSVAKQGRDSKRQSDLRSIQSALEQYFADQLFYPSNASNSMDSLLSMGGQLTSSTGNPSPPSTTKTYMKSLPQDPTGTYRYRYDPIPTTPCDNSQSSKCTSYCIYAHLENPLSPIPSPPTGCVYPNNNYNFAVSPP